MSHIIGRPDDNLLDIMLGRQGGDPEQAVIGGSEQGRPEEDDEPGDEPTHGSAR